MINPAGISSEASYGEKRFCVQTEFAPRPKPRITTSVSLNGEVVQKVENLWEKLPQSEEDKDEIERFLRKQHQKVIKEIKEKGKRFVLSKDEAKKIATGEEEQWERVILRVKELISATQGVTGYMLFSKDEQIIPQDILNSKDKICVDLAQCRKDLASFLSSVSKVGNFIGGLLEGKKMRMVFIPIKNNFFAGRVNPDVDLKDLVQKIRSVV
ncbi:MAG: hypothetical protein ACE5K2_05875 [Candidatus Zixiibacteriota bacterium]